MDTRASHHVTPNLQKLNLQSEFEGPDALISGDGSTLPITYTGSTLLHSPSQTFHLNEILHVPRASKNLVSISKFCGTNKIFVEFFLSFLLVKDLHTRRPLV